MEKRGSGVPSGHGSNFSSWCASGHSSILRSSEAKIFSYGNGGVFFGQTRKGKAKSSQEQMHKFQIKPVISRTGFPIFRSFLGVNF